MTKFNVGDRVRVRNGLEIGKLYYMENNEDYNSFELYMSQFCGVETKISNVTSSRQYNIEIDDCFCYTDEMLEAIMGEEN